MFERINKKVKGFFSSQRMKTLALKKIMMVVGACIFLIAAAQALPLFFGIGG